MRMAMAAAVRFWTAPPAFAALCLLVALSCAAEGGFQKGDCARVDPRFDPQTEQRIGLAVLEAESGTLPDDDPLNGLRISLQGNEDAASAPAQAPPGVAAARQERLDRLNAELHPDVAERWTMDRIGEGRWVTYRKVVVEMPDRPSYVIAHGYAWHRGHHVTCQITTKIGRTLGDAISAWNVIVEAALRLLAARFGGAREEPAADEVEAFPDTELPLAASLSVPVLEVIAGDVAREGVVWVSGGRPGVAAQVRVEKVGGDGEAGIEVRVGEPIAGDAGGGPLWSFPLTVSAPSTAAHGLVSMHVVAGQPGAESVRLTLRVAVNPATVGAGADRGEAPESDAPVEPLPEEPPVKPSETDPARAAEEQVERGLDLMAQERVAEAEAAFRKAVELAPRTAACRARLGAFYLERERWAEAAGAFREAIRLEPAQPMHRAELAWVLLQQGDREAALREAREAMRLGATRDDHVVFEDLGLVK